MNKYHLPLKFSPLVRESLNMNKPVLALESTVVTHGLPYPQNFETMQALEAEAWAEGVVPATIAIIKGKCCVGLEKQDKEHLTELFSSGKQAEIAKISLRDIPLALVQGISGGTTVSATMLLAHEAGIRVFATGGIGGVHRGWQSSLDISSDIDALAKIPVIVVCAGSKAILDIEASLEALESRSIPLIGWQTNEYPTFYSRSSGIYIPMVNSVREVADLYRMMQSCQYFQTGLLVANPIPAEYEIPFSEIEPHILQAVAEAKAQNICGKELTPFLLNRLAQSTRGRSVEANLALLKNNVRTAAKIAKEFV
jgi:pseudouridylate synthase